ncbi:hypothetical protein [Alloscardovia criceti]|uniref:hypothetical protein n=1 Tax=Alloscardovia criceti TaxID=356828 RepID=UPI00037FE69E|nr:hypothetical protein [Alloscardovia criceti]
MRIIVLNRISVRHPELSKSDVVTAFESIYAEVPRKDNTWIALGTDQRLREIEMLYTIDYARNEVIICHAFTPPTKKIKAEMNKRKRRLR